MKKFFKILLINIIFLFFASAIMEIILVKHYRRFHPNSDYKITRMSYDRLFEIYKFRPVEGREYKKRPIIILGCSYAYGLGLRVEETLGHKLSLYTKRPVYNFSIYGKGLQNTLYLLQNNMIEPVDNPEYVFYIFMSDQIRRLYSTVCFEDYIGYPIYKQDKNGNLVLKSKYYPIYKKFYTYYLINNIYQIYFNLPNRVKHSELVNAFLKEIHKEIKKKYPSAKFVVVMYDDCRSNFGLNLNPSIEDGIEIIHTDDLSKVMLHDNKYHIKPDDFHPNGNAWDVLVPEIAKKYNL